MSADVWEARKLLLFFKEEIRLALEYPATVEDVQYAEVRADNNKVSGEFTITWKQEEVL